MANHFLHYWVPSTVDAELARERPLRVIGSNQLSPQKIQTGDTIWIATVLAQRLYLVARILVDRVIVGRSQAIAYFNDDKLWDADYFIAARSGTETPIRILDISDIANKLSFDSPASPTLILQQGQVNAQQLQTTRTLTSDSATLLADWWYASEAAGPGDDGWAPVLFKGLMVTRSSILEAIAAFDERYPDTNQYDSWLEKGSYKFALLHRGKVYPCKHILSRATDVSTEDFSGGTPTNRVFEQLGFKIVAKHEVESPPHSLGDSPAEEQAIQMPEEASPAEGIRFREGTVKQVHVNVYERDPRARRICIQHYGYVCIICGFDFSKVYGEIGQEFIHVHHLHPLAEVGEAYELDPVQDLRPVCPNCHAMIHRQTPAYSVEQIRALISEAKAKTAR